MLRRQIAAPNVADGHGFPPWTEFAGWAATWTAAVVVMLGVRVRRGSRVARLSATTANAVGCVAGSADQRGGVGRLARADAVVGVPASALAGLLVVMPAQAVLFGWLRLASGSLWPALAAHAAYALHTAPFLILADAESCPDPVLYAPGLGGVIGVVVLGVVVAFLAATGQIRVRSWDAALTDKGVRR